MIRFSFLLALVLMAAPLFAQHPAARAARCPECFPGGPVFTPYPTQVRMPSRAYYPPVYGGGWGGGWGMRGGGVWTGVAATAAGAGIAVAVDEIQQRRAEAAEARQERREKANRRGSEQPVQVKNCRVYEATDNKDAPALMVCEDRDGNKITFERERK